MTLVALTASWTRRALLAAAVAFTALPASAQTPIRFQLDWRFEGPAALFLASDAKGYYKAAGLNVTIDAGNGSGGTVTRVASGTYDMGFADLAALMEFHANNPDAPNKPVAVMMVYNNTPAAVLTLKKTGIRTPADLSGRKMGAPVFDAGRRGFPIFQKANAIGAVNPLQAAVKNSFAAMEAAGEGQHPGAGVAGLLVHPGRAGRGDGAAPGPAPAGRPRTFARRTGEETRGP